MGHKTLIGGTAYDISGGKTLIGGTAYSIKGGRTLIGGTGYDISFVSPKEQTVQALFTSATLIDISGRNASTRTGFLNRPAFGIQIIVFEAIRIG